MDGYLEESSFRKPVNQRGSDRVRKGRPEPRMITSMPGAADSSLSKDGLCFVALLDIWSLLCLHCQCGTQVSVDKSALERVWLLLRCWSD